MNFLKRFFFNRERKQINLQSQFESWDNIKSVLILFKSEYTEKNSVVKELISYVQSQGKQVVTFTYVDKKHSDTATLENYIVIDRSTVNWLGVPYKTRFAAKLNEKYDVVIDLTPDECLPLMYLLIWAKSSFRCSKRRDLYNLHDFMIDIPEPPVDPKTKMVDLHYSEEKVLCLQILKYLQQIKSV
ncbi:MAG: hypothetical protein R3Y59_04355 [bacterium]